MRTWCGLVVVAIFVFACGDASPPPTGTGGTAGSGAIGGGGSGSGAGGVGGGGVGGGGCPTGDSFNAGSDPNRNMVTATQVCQRLAEIQCAAERCCCPNGNARKYESLDACVTSQSNICRTLGSETVTADARTGFNATALNTAFGEFERLASSCDVDIVNWGTSQEGFAGVLTGTVSPGGDCWLPLTDGQDPAAIASCGSVNACLGTSIGITAWKCGARLNEGGRCLVDPSCRDGLFCDPLPSANDPTLGTCMTRRGETAPCTRATECASLFCIGGHCAPPSVEAAYCIKP